MLIGSMATGLASGGGFCAGSKVVCVHQVCHFPVSDLQLMDKQKINSSASVFSASLPAMLATTASAAIQILKDQPNLLQSLQTNIQTFRQQLSKLEPLPISFPSPSSTPPQTASHQFHNKDAIIHIPSHPSSGLLHIFLLHPPGTLEEEERWLQEIVDETMNSAAVLVTRARRLRGQEIFEPEPSLKICISGAASRKDVEKAGMGLRAALVKICGSTSSLPKERRGS